MSSEQSEIPLAPTDLWVRRREPLPLLLARFCALVVQIAAPLTGWTSLALISLIGFISQCGTNLARRTLFLRNLYALPALRENSRDAKDPREEWPGVTYIGPARNEEEGIEIAARSIAALDYPNLDILFIDDHSTDATPQILDRLAAEFPRIKVLHDPPLHEGWLGKANGVWQAVQQSDPEKPWLVIADADVVFEPKALKCAIALAERDELDFLTCVVHVENKTLSEELYIASAWSAMIQGAHATRLNDPKTAPIGIGAFILVKRSVYLESGGHAAIRNRQPEDTLLAALIKRHGGRVGVCWTRNMMRVRIYRGYKQLRQFMVRKIRMQVEDKLVWVFNRGVYILLSEIFPLPLAVAGVASQFVRGEFSISMSLYALGALASYLTMVASSEKIRIISYMRPGLEWFHPLGGLLRSYFNLIAGAQLLFGKRMEWRGRSFSNE